MEDMTQLMTEQSNERSAAIEEQSIEAILQYMNDENQKVMLAIQACIPKITQVVEAVVRSFEQGGRLIYLGAGTSGRLGVLDASECPPTFGVSPEMVVGLIAGGDYALRNAIEGAEDDETMAAQQLGELRLTTKDTVIGISASGRTPYVAGGLRYAKEVGAFTAAISNSPESLISSIAQVGIEALTGPEVVTGSTRLKAGTSQKIILNMVTTTAMIKIGKVFRGYMVDVQPTNQKLKQRAVNIFKAITQVDDEMATTQLVKHQYDLKTALISQLHQISSDEATELLQKHHMNIVKAMYDQK